MCSPTLALAFTAAGAASQTVGAYYAAASQRDALRQRADLNEQQAQRVLEAGQFEEQRSRLGTASTKGAQRAAAAAGGVDLGSGTALHMLTATDLLGEVDAQHIRSNAVRSAWGYRTEATMQRASADAINPLLAAGSTLMGQAGQVSESWYRLKKAGAFDQPPSKGYGAGGGGQVLAGY